MASDGPRVFGELLLHCLKKLWSRGDAFHADTNVDFICRCAIRALPEHQDNERVKDLEVTMEPEELRA